VRLKTYLSVLGDIRHKTMTPNCQKIFNAHSSDLFFSKGWGDWIRLRDLSERKDYLQKPRSIDIRWYKTQVVDGIETKWGNFLSPFGELPDELRLARLKWVGPVGHGKVDPICIVFPMTGDQGYNFREENLAVPLARTKKMAFVLPEAPFYGQRKPSDQRSFLINTVEEILMMCLAMVEEGRSLLGYFEERGCSQLGVAGLSQGGMFSMIVGATYPSKIAVATSLCPHSPEVIFTDGVLRNFVDWEKLGLSGPEEATEKFRLLFQSGNIYSLPLPHTQSGVIVQGAKRDLVVPRHSVERVMKHWSFAKRHWMPGTHTTSLLFQKSEFQKLIYLSIYIGITHTIALL
jgi:hypothetical protein